MAENLFSIELVTPERILVTGAATEVILRTAEGDLSFLAGHTPLVGTVEPGVIVVVREEGHEERVAVHGGFVQVEQGVTLEAPGTLEEVTGRVGTGSRVTLLVGVAERVEEIDADRARAALERAEARMAELTGAGRGAGPSADEEEQPDADLVEAEGALRRAQVRLAALDASSGVGTGIAG